MILKRKGNSKSERLSSSALDHADCPRAPGGPSARPRRTVRRHRADRPRGLSGLSARLRRTVRKEPPNLQYCTLSNGPSALTRTVRHSSTDRLRTSCNKNPSTKRIKWKACKNTTNCWLKVTSRTVHVERRQQIEPDLLKVNSSFPLPDLLNQPRNCYQIIGEGEAPLGDAMPTNL
jgi:hypothetical protein